MNITFKTKNFFFDRKAVIDRFGAKGTNSLKAMSRVGAFIRTSARSMLRRRKKVSASGAPPSIHTSDQTITLKNIQFAYDFQRSSLVVGPVKVNGKSGGIVAVPQLLEKGGSVTRRGKSLHYSAHPWMAPALQAEMSNIPRQWSAKLR